MQVQDLISRWLHSRTQSGIQPLTIRSYRTSVSDFIRLFGKVPVDDLEPTHFRKWKSSMLDRLAHGTVRTRAVHIRGAFRWAHDEGLADMPRMGSDFMRLRMSPPHRGVFSKDEMAALIGGSDGWMRVCVLLGINLGLGNTDCARLRPEHVQGEFLDMLRPKTKNPRRGWLWPETRDALRSAALPFRLKTGGSVCSINHDGVNREFRNLARRVGVYQPGRSFYSLRRTYRTIVDRHLDRPAIDLTMGHSTPGMGARYVASISDDRLRAVGLLARQWVPLFSGPSEPNSASALSA